MASTQAQGGRHAIGTSHARGTRGSARCPREQDRLLLARCSHRGGVVDAAQQSDVVPPGAELVYYEHPDLTYPDPRGGFYWFMSQRWRSTAQIDYARGAAAASSAAAQH